MASIFGLGFQAPHFVAVASDFIGEALQSIANAVTAAVKNFFVSLSNCFPDAPEKGSAEMYAAVCLSNNQLKKKG